MPTNMLFVNDINSFLVVGPRARVEHPRTEWRPGSVRDASGRMRAGQRLSGGYLEGDRPVPPTCERNQFVQRCMYERRSRPSVLDIGRRRSVGCRCRTHCIAHAHVQTDMCMILTHTHTYCHASVYECDDERSQCFSHCDAAQADQTHRCKTIVSQPTRATERTRTCYALNVVAERRFQHLRNSKEIREDF